jgi:Ca2+-binding RTX toxin-like protein
MMDRRALAVVPRDRLQLSVRNTVIRLTRIQGDGGNDTIFGDNANLDLDATAGSAGGEDNLNGGPGNDTLRAGPANDNLDGGAATDPCHGERGNDTFERCETVT